jgi:hypothetical protein
MNSKMINLLFGLIIVLYGVFGKTISENLSIVNEIEVVDLYIDEPSETILNDTKAISGIITEKEDRLAFAVFNKVCSNRMQKWPNITQQDLNDVYVEAAKKYFGNSIDNKYEGLGSFIESKFESVTGEDIHTLTKTEIEEISQILLGVSWNLVN